MDLTNRFLKYKAYPPVPNWYTSNVTAVVEPHFFLYATRNLVVVLGLDDFKYFNSFAASSEKIQAIAAHETFCYTAGVDNVVRCWNILLGSLLTSHDEHKAEVTTLKLIRQGTVMISGDKSGKIVIMEPFGKLKHNATKVKSEITSLAITTHQGQDYVAVGYANGMIFVEHIGHDLVMSTQFQLANDNDMIQSLDWQKLPTQQNELEDQWPLLASSTKRKKNILIWTFPTRSILTTIRLPNPPAQATEQQKSTVFIELAWSLSQKNKLYFSSYIGSINCFVITNKAPKICNNERLEKHNRNVFSINWYNGGRNCITTSLDKQIIKWDVNKKSCLQILKTQTGFPYSFDTSHYNPGQLAIGMGDNSIKLWNFSDCNSVMKANKNHDYYYANVLWKGLQGKIEKIKYNPSSEGLLAYANEYGHVGMYDIINLRHIPFKTYHKQQGAPSIDWGNGRGMLAYDYENVDRLFSCGSDGTIHVYNSQSPQNQPYNLNYLMRERNPAWFTSLEAKNSHRIVLKIDEKHKYIAFGHTDGLVEVYEIEPLRLIFVSNCQRQLIRALDWKYTNTGLLLASGDDQGDIAIHDIGAVNVSDTTDTTEVKMSEDGPFSFPVFVGMPVPHSEAMVLLKGHKNSITDIRWCSDSVSTLIASASEDNFVAVWDGLTGDTKALFNRHRSRVLSVCWNPSEANVLFSGSEDRFIYEWNLNDFPCKGPIQSQLNLYDLERSALTQSGSKRKANSVDTANNSTASSPASNTFTLKKKQKKSNASTAAVNQSNVSTSMPVSQESEKSTSRLKKEQYCLVLADDILKGKVKETVTNITSTYLNEEQKADATVSRYTNFWQQQPQHENIHDLFFGEKNDVRRLIEIEVKALNEKEVVSPSEPTYAAQNNVKNNLDIKLAMDITQCQYSMFSKDQFDKNVNSCMSDWITLALSPMVGKETWNTLMLEQAKKLESLKQYHLSASCYIACTHIYEAIEVYRKQSMFREAIALAKLRLPPKDPIIDKLFADWANELQKGDADTLTATCYLMSNLEGSMSHAINALARGGKESGLFYAACLATAAEDGTKTQRIEQWLRKLNERLLKKASVNTSS